MFVVLEFIWQFFRAEAYKLWGWSPERQRHCIATDTPYIQPVELSLKPGGVSEGTYITQISKGIYSALYTQETYFYPNLRKRQDLLKERKIHAAVTG